MSHAGSVPRFAGEVGDILISVVTKPAAREPYNLTEVDLTEHQGIVAPWNDCGAGERQCRSADDAGGVRIYIERGANASAKSTSTPSTAVHAIFPSAACTRPVPYRGALPLGRAAAPPASVSCT
jgi:hypothetical protein